MGTSKGYPLPTGGNWTDLKREATQFVQAGSGSDAAALLSRFIQTNGGSTGWASGKGAGGRTGGAAITGQGARQAGRNLGGFLAQVGAGGLATAIEELGLANFMGRSATDVSMALLDTLAGPANTLDDAAARAALAALMRELLGATKTFEQIEQALQQALDRRGIGKILMRFFALYVYECFCRHFYENWRRKVDDRKAKSQLKMIKNCIDKSLKAKVGARDPVTIRWNRPEGQRLTERILQETLEIFGGTS